MFSILKRNGEKRKVKLSLFNSFLTGLILYLLRYRMLIPPIQLDSSKMTVFLTSKMYFYFKEHFQLI